MTDRLLRRGLKEGHEGRVVGEAQDVEHVVVRVQRQQQQLNDQLHPGLVQPARPQLLQELRAEPEHVVHVRDAIGV